MNKKSLLIYGSIILAMLFWSFSFVWVKIVYTVYNPITTVILRLIISTILLFVIGKGFKRIEKIEKKDRMQLLLLAFFEPFLYFMGESFGLKLVSSTLGAVIISTIPLFSPVAAYFFHREKIGIMGVVGIIISIIGVSVIIFNKNFNLIASPLGIALMFLAVGAAVGYSIVLKKLAAKYNPVSLISYQNLLGIFFFLPLFFTFDYQHFIAAKPTTEVMISILELAIFASSLAFIFFTYGLNYLGITKSNIFINAIPVFTAIFAYFVIDEVITLQKMVGITIVISGLFLSQIKLNFNKQDR
ncbi:DMT family transporter [Labilibaculum sp. DW002]|uniref:DMT family transporter n=1 Tax=Paralabilibaculum antarcticum TaxID=2912572 RepID=A0ABT5VS64_9BACT|nr:DMT family transporter [Labilibaculum sp. DW002]MDE5418267.1 DMT family transporter [Labilibaculum sp. DW002]